METPVLVTPRKWYSSKTLWANTIAAVAGLIQYFGPGFLIPPEEQGAILVVVNIILRIVTKAPLA